MMRRLRWVLSGEADSAAVRAHLWRNVWHFCFHSSTDTRISFEPSGVELAAQLELR